MIFILNANRMNRSTNGNSRGGNSTLVMVMGMFVFILICAGLYYLYNWLYGDESSSSATSLIASNVVNGKPLSLVAPATSGSVASKEIKGIKDGGAYSVSFWVYISDTKGFSQSGGMKLAHLLDITAKTGGQTLIFVALNPKDGSLIVRESTNDTEYIIDDSAGNSDSHKYSRAQITANYNTTPQFKQDDRCDVINGIEYQRWILVTAVANSRTLDVYIDGKLTRSCVYKAAYALGRGSDGIATATFGRDNNGMLNGNLGKSDYYDYALTPAQIWSIYQAGPGAPTTLSSFFSNLFGLSGSLDASGSSIYVDKPSGRPWTYLG